MPAASPTAGASGRKRPYAELPENLSARLADLDFSELGRHPRFPPGWHLLPAIAIGWAVLIIAASYLVGRFVL